MGSEVLSLTSKARYKYYFCRESTFYKKEMNQKARERIKKITPILIFNILLPTIDIITDLLIIIRLFEGSYKCNQDDSTASLFEYEQCKAYGPHNYCSSLSNICKIKDIHPFFEDKCQEGHGLDVVKNMCITTAHP